MSDTNAQGYSGRQEQKAVLKGPKTSPQPDETVRSEDEAIVNTEEQNEVVNEEGNFNPPNEETLEKERGYQEGIKNDSLTEPEFRDSDDQLEFSGEEGK
ncbi:MAG: hypothetical protein WKI04_01340 [Ferruginibacter sp.]